MISYCITLRNRAGQLDRHVENLLGQSLCGHEIELCVSDGYSDDSPREVLLKYRPRLKSIRFCHSDRSSLPFKIPSNNPACDKNALVANVATGDIVVLTDPEVCWTDRESLARLLGLVRNPREWISVPAYMGSPGQVAWGYRPIDKGALRGIYSGAGFCLVFHRKTFLEMRGFEEGFAAGFACEDTYFCDSWRREQEEVVVDERVFHHWHDDKHLLPENRDLLEVNLRVARSLNCAKANLNNPDWARPEMIKDLEELCIP